MRREDYLERQSDRRIIQSPWNQTTTNQASDAARPHGNARDRRPILFPDRIGLR